MKVSNHVFIAFLPITLVLATVIAASAGEKTWTSGGPAGGVFRAIAVDPTAAGTVYVNVGTSGVWKTTDGGATWAIAFNQSGQSIAINPTNTSNVFVATTNGVVYKSTDSGATWTYVPSLSFSGNPVEQVMQIGFQPGTGNLYALTAQGVSPYPAGNDRIQILTPGATAWTVSDALTPSLSMFAFDSSAPNTIYVAGKYATTCCLYKSTDGGKTFGGTFPSDLMGNHFGISSVAVGSTSSAILYAATTSGVRKSTDGGNTWSTTALTDPNIISVVVAPSSNTTVYAASGSGLYKTTNGGTTWATLQLPSYSPVTSDVEVASSTPSTLYASTYSGFFKSTDSGATWASAADGISQTIGQVVAACPTNVNRFYGGTVGSGFFRSDDAGASWQLDASGLPAVDAWAIAVDPTDDNTAWTGTSNGIYKTTTGASFWQLSASGIPADNNGTRLVRQLIIDPGNNSVLYAGIDGVGVYKSMNGGASWSAANTGIPESVAGALAIDRNSPSDLYWGSGYSGKIYSSSSAGSNWALLSTPTTGQVAAIAVDPTSSSRILVGYHFPGGLYFTTDAGSSWTKASTASGSIASLQFDPVSGSVFAATNGGVQRSTDHGATWTTVGSFASGPIDTTDLVITRQDEDYLRITASTFRPGGMWDYVYPAPVFTAASAPDVQPMAQTSTNFNLGSFTDTGDEGPWTVTVNWGDGTTDVFQASATGDLSRTHTYASDGTFTVSTKVSNVLALSAGGSFSLTVLPAIFNTSTTLTTNANPSVFGQAVTFTATVTVVSPGYGTPSGTVTFSDGSTTIGTATLSGGTASFTASNLTVGGHNLTAGYSGADHFYSSASNAITQTVNQAQTTTQASTSVNPSVSGQMVTLTTTVTAVAPGSGSPSGTVTFNDGTTRLGTSPLNGGVASLTLGTLSVGSHNITATYGGDGNFLSSTSNAIAQNVNQAQTAISMTATVNPSVFGQPVTFTTALIVVAPGSGSPAGSVTFADGGVTIGAASVSGGTASLTTSALSVGSHIITATYAWRH